MLKEELEKHNGAGELLAPITEALLSCVKDNNYKVSLGAMECMKIVLVTSGDQLKVYSNQLVELLIDRLGDNKVRARPRRCNEKESKA